ncbi:hypothetical protein SAMN05216526_1760 [Ectothiorhodosinus mongolicus]|uniref:Uncharacterized protein n=1 Tax=Ectothiorhodosinus mongolicus TaxID=233100 RepID=A0A1R3W544_9GAMM|nr:hypothetical protein CKX93_07825 [Ectothiorhodosinus mongolicus]SIT72904.1 hypothetical protein SAMN05216526_1760 [Ectothiorhodosinus mongolicus]
MGAKALKRINNYGGNRIKHLLSVAALVVLLVFAAGSSDEETTGNSNLYSGQTYNAAENPRTWTNPIQGGQNFFNINARDSGESRLTLYISSRNCDNVTAVWGFAVRTVEEVYNINGQNVRVKPSTVKLLDLYFLEAVTSEGNRYVLDTMMNNPRVVITDESGRSSTIDTAGINEAHRSIVLFCRNAAERKAGAL